MHRVPPVAYRLLAGGLAGALLLLAELGASQVTRAQDAGKPPGPPSAAGADVCIACHKDVPAAQKKDWHSRLVAARRGPSNCEDCHGPSSQHAENPLEVPSHYDLGRAPAGKSAQACFVCHKTKHSSARWRASEHAQANVRCWDCHSNVSSPHSLTSRLPDTDVCYTCHREQRATFELTSHHPVREGRIECYECHDTHRPQSHRDRREVCVSCHGRQRGPFIFPHGAISGGMTEACLDCHQAHGSPNRRLLKFAGRGVCLQCHADKAMHFVGKTCWTSGCHTAVHGSNRSPLLLGP